MSTNSQTINWYDRRLGVSDWQDVAKEWERQLEFFAADLSSTGRPTSTVSLRIRTVRSFANGLTVRPFDMTRDLYRARMAELPQSPTRTSMRSFYRWAVRTARIDRDPTWEPSRLPQPGPVSSAWQSAIELFATAQKASGLADTTIDVSSRLIRLFAEEVVPSPWQMTREAIYARFDDLPVSESTRRRYMTAVRGFYRWAASTGRVQVDPAAKTMTRTAFRPASPEWESELLPFSRHLRALGCTEPSIRTMTSGVRRIARELPRTSPYKVTTDDLLEVLASKPLWQSETRRSHVNALRAFYRWAKAVRRTKRNPAKAIPAVRRQHKVSEPATTDAILTAIAKADPRERLMVRLAAELGLRRSEVAQMHAEDLTHRGEGWWLLVHGKGQKERRLPVTDSLALSIRARGDGYVFPGKKNGHLGPQEVGAQVSELLPPGVTMHKLRHRFATDAYAVDHDLLAVQELLGHANPETTRGYVRTPELDKRRLVDAVTVAR